MKFAFSSNAFLRYSLIDTIGIIARAGYQGIEIMADVPHAYPSSLSDRDVSDIRRALDDNGLEISNVNAFMHHANGDTWHPSWIESDPSERQRRIDFTLEAIDLACKLGACCISTEPGGPLEGIPREHGMNFFREGLAAVEDHARKAGVRVLIEPEPGLLIENSAQFLDLSDWLDLSVFGLNFDIGHFYCVGEDPAELVDKLRGAWHHFHLEDIAASRKHFHLIPGLGVIDIPGVLNRIAGTGYEGFVTVELYTYEDQAEKAAEEAFSYLARWQESRATPVAR